MSVTQAQKGSDKLIPRVAHLNSGPVAHTLQCDDSKHVEEKASQFCPQDETATACIRNPLAGIPTKTLLAQLDSFVDQAGLQDKRAVFRKGALVA